MLIHVFHTLFRYNLTGHCDGTPLLFQKEGYLDVYLYANQTDGTIFMEKIGMFIELN